MFFVDDLVVAYRKSTRREAEKFFDYFKEKKKKKIEIKDMGEVEFFLGIKVVRNRPEKKLWLS